MGGRGGSSMSASGKTALRKKYGDAPNGWGEINPKYRKPSEGGYYTVSDEVDYGRTMELVEELGIKPWERNGMKRYYLNEHDLGQVIGLEQTHYKSGYISGSQYRDASGDIVNVAHSRGYSRMNKTYIENGRVYSDWRPYGVDIASLAAENINKHKRYKRS